MDNFYLCPSMMCADFGNLSEEVRRLNEAGADMFHLDLMDGSFVPSFAMGFEDIKCIAELSEKPVDVHMMVNEPLKYVKQICEMGADIIYIHPEADTHPARTLDAIKNCNASPGIAVNPGTSFESVKELLHLVDYVLIMTVNPGYAGQKYLDYVDHKLSVFVENKLCYGYEVFVDGAISPDKIQSLSKKGVNGFVLGTSALFKPEADYNAVLQNLKAILH